MIDGATERLYYTDAYRTTFEAKLVATADEGRRVYLDRTTFYPTSGGQPHDVGLLNGVEVVDVIDEGPAIAHVLASAVVAEAGSGIEGAIDWPRRFDHMQQHTGQHVLSAVFADLFGHRTVSVHFGAESSTLDLNVGSVDRDKLVRAEARANQIVFDDVPIGVSFEDAARASGLRKETDRGGTIRVVTIDGIDRSACGGTHVRRTGEIGAITLRKVDRVRGSARIEFLCGARAVRRARSDFEALSGIAASLSSSFDDAPERVAATVDQLRDAERARKRLIDELSSHRARELYSAAAPDAHGVRWIVHNATNAEFDESKAIAHAATDLKRAACLVTVDQPPRILLATSEDSGLDAGAVLRDVLGAVGGRGGGSPRLAQGTVPDADAVVTVRARLIG